MNNEQKKETSQFLPTSELVAKQPCELECVLSFEYINPRKEKQNGTGTSNSTKASS